MDDQFRRNQITYPGKVIAKINPFMKIIFIDCLYIHLNQKQFTYYQTFLITSHTKTLTLVTFKKKSYIL